jgi:hypothetical protein
VGCDEREAKKGMARCAVWINAAFLTLPKASTTQMMLAFEMHAF